MNGEERVFKVTCDKATGKWSYENKCYLVKCKKPSEIELGMGTLLETAPLNTLWTMDKICM